MAGEAGAAARAVRGHAVVAEDQVVVPELAQHPPARLDVLVRVGHVGVVGVDPEADALGHPLPVGDVAEHGLAALRVEGGDAVRLDVALVAQPQRALDLEFDGQAVRVPAAFAGRAVAAHGLVARDQVLEDARQHVVHAGRAVGRRRSLVEREQPLRRALLDAAPEDVVLAPEREDVLLERGERDPRGRGLEARPHLGVDHGSPPCGPRGGPVPAPCPPSGGGHTRSGPTRIVPVSTASGGRLRCPPSGGGHTNAPASTVRRRTHESFRCPPRAADPNRSVHRGGGRIAPVSTASGGHTNRSGAHRERRTQKCPPRTGRASCARGTTRVAPLPRPRGPRRRSPRHAVALA